MGNALNFVKNSNQNNNFPINPKALDHENYLRGKSTLNNPAQIQNILNQTDIQNIKSIQPNTYNNYARNVLKQDELLNRIKESHSSMLNKEMILKSQLNDVKNLGQLNKLNNDMVKIAYDNRRQAFRDFKVGKSDPFTNFLMDPTIFPQQQEPYKDQQNNLDPLGELDRLSQPLVKPNSPASGLPMNNLPISSNIDIKENEDQVEPLTALSLRPLPRNSAVSPLINRLSLLSPGQKNNSPGIKHYSNPDYRPSPGLKNSQLHNQPNPQNPPHQSNAYPNYQNGGGFGFQPPPVGYQQPIVNVIPIPMPQNDKRSSSVSSHKDNKFSEEVKTMLNKQNELLQKFLDKVERNSTLETKEDYPEKYEHRIKELEKNFDLSQEVLNLRKQLYSFNSEKNIKEEKTVVPPPPSMFMPMSMQQPFQYYGGYDPMMMMMNMGMGPWNPQQSFYPYGNQWGGMNNMGMMPQNFNQT